MADLLNIQEKKLPLSVILSIGIFGVVLVFASGFFVEEPQQEINQTTATGISGLSYTIEDLYVASLEERIADLLSSVADVGKTKIMVTLKSSQEHIYAQEKITGLEEDSEEYILIDGSDGKEALILRSITPQIQGVVVVCDGGASPVVQERVSNVLATALGIGYSQISVQQRAN